MYVVKKIGFEDIKSFLVGQNTILMNTLLPDEQQCLIRGTLSVSLEEKTINDLLEKYEMHQQIIVVYGKNCTDESAERKVKQLLSLGFSEVFLYVGGMFEWMLLQDIYGETEFPTTGKVLDILKYKPMRMLTG